MAASALLRSLASKMARAPSSHHRSLLTRGLHGGVRSGPGVSLPATGLQSLATKFARALPPPHHLLHERGLRSLNSPNSGASASTPPAGKMDLLTALPKIRAGLAYLTLLGCLIYMHGSLIPRLERLEGKLAAQKKVKLNDNLTQSFDAVELHVAKDVSTSVPEAQIMQSSGYGMQPAGGTGKGKSIQDLQDQIT